ncbi:MAG: DJ-1 family glyoxalase III [bacterium]
MKIAALVADGFEEIELISVIDLLRRAEIKTEIWGLNQLQISGGHNIKLTADKIFPPGNSAEIDGLFLPGGKQGVENLVNSPPVLNLIENLYNKQKWLVAICAAPLVLETAGVLQGKTVTIYPGWESKLITAERIVNQPVVIDGKIITSRGVGTALELGLTLCRLWCGQDQADHLASAILYDQR